mmetsp:Transcript_28615/g.67054  ORF Transcript_28615/g.67054 Transcript_28615/m.67054 type:complete len:244 (+) Transcript_28615:502-1233(+)
MLRAQRRTARAQAQAPATAPARACAAAAARPLRAAESLRAAGLLRQSDANVASAVARSNRHMRRRGRASRRRTRRGRCRGRHGQSRRLARRTRRTQQQNAARAWPAARTRKAWAELSKAQHATRPSREGAESRRSCRLLRTNQLCKSLPLAPQPCDRRPSCGSRCHSPRRLAATLLVDCRACEGAGTVRTMPYAASSDRWARAALRPQRRPSPPSRCRQAWRWRPQRAQRTPRCSPQTRGARR